ncbi:polygalacturonase inhibitor 1-like [Telopea speciosissima]|uniref:polygalacturonase inhibitor 1-like n=1 Tax=Telopea speciosissima TaxID=54955 RepID=UPI001CC5011B|nr:polygalacturonase inhibitor 1-like [Telopea speciosissima]
MEASPTTRLSYFPTLLLLSFLPTPSSSSSSRSLATSVSCNKQDYTALMKIKASLLNPHHLASWIPNTDCCNWSFVKCTSNTNLNTELSIFEANISGQIPAEVGDLTYLNYLAFQQITNLTGTITKLKFLGTLLRCCNNLSGPIPSFLGQLTNLVYLELNFNQLSGSIPESLGKSISWLILSDNQLSGKIPKSFGDAHFDYINLLRNKLEGDASMLFISHNSFLSWDLPSLHAIPCNPILPLANGSTWNIEVASNTLAFNLSKVGFAKNLWRLDISHNKIFGSIPETITGSIEHLNVSYNQLCGKIPQGGKVQKFDSYSFYHNNVVRRSPLVKQRRM